MAPKIKQKTSLTSIPTFRLKCIKLQSRRQFNIHNGRKIVIKNIDLRMILLIYVNHNLQHKSYPYNQPMKQRFWKELKTKLCPKQNWVNSSDQPTCQCCFKQFIFIIRNRHHCRFCGKLFCSDCTSHFINGTYIGLDSQKFVRCCEFCHEDIQRCIRECSKVAEMSYEKNEFSEQSDEQQSEEYDSYNLKKIFQENQKTTQAEILDKLDEEVKKVVKIASDYFCSKFQVDGKVWAPKLADLAIRAANQAKMDSMTEGVNESAMDIAKKVRIKTITTEQNQITCVMMKGIVIQKSLPIKNMISQLSKPRILVVQKSIDMQSLSQFLKFEELVKNEKQIMKKILQKLVKLTPDIIFVEHSVSMFALEYFQEHKIAVICKLKPKDLQMIKCVGKIKKTIKKLWLIDKYKSHNVMGSCDKIYFKVVREGKTLMFMEGEVGIRSVILGQSQQQTANMLKKSLQILMRFARRKNLQKYLAVVENQMICSSFKKFKFVFMNGIISNELQQENKLVRQDISFTQAYFSNINLLTDGKKAQFQYVSRMGKNKTRQICGNIEFERKKIYSTGDMTLGSFILLISANFEKICNECKYTHSHNIYINKCCVKINVEKTQLYEKGKSFIQDINDGEGLTLQNLKFFLKKQKQLLVIETYLKCTSCFMNMCTPIKVGKNYLENSFYNFIANISEYQSLQIQKTMLLKSQGKISFRKSSFENCWHEDIMRVFEYSGISITLEILKTTTLEVSYINIQSPEAQALYTTYDESFIRTTYASEIQQKKDILQKISNLMPSLNNVTHIPLSNKLITYINQMNKIREIIDKTKEELTDVEGKVSKNQTIGQDWTLFMRQIYKIQAVLIPAISILIFLDLQIKKESLQESFMKEPQPRIQNQQMVVKNEDNDITVRESYAHLAKDIDSYGQLQKFIKKQGKIRFPRSEGVFLYFNPIFVNDPVTVIASGLNSQEFKKYIQEGNIPNELKLKLSFNYRIKTMWQTKNQMQSIYGQFFPQNVTDKDKIQTVQLTIYYHKQFQDLRKRQGLSLDLFVRSMCGCRSWSSSGGKSNSKFAKSHNQLLVVKVINQKQFVQFQRFCPSYLSYIKQSKQAKEDSLLARIYGIYEVSMKGKQEKCIVMQNIFFGMTGNLKVYDLKGSQLNRLNIPQFDQKNITGQDANFKLDRDGEPLILPPVDYDKVIKTLQYDAGFLKEQAVIDYSLLVILNANKCIRLGIIDFMRPYQFLQKVQTIYKNLKSRQTPTVIPPEDYAQRFVKAMKKYFIKVQV